MRSRPETWERRKAAYRERYATDRVYREARRQYQREWYITDKLRRWGVTRAKLVSLRKLGCALCGAKNKRLFMDHNHTYDSFRGLLCNKCNVSLGWAEKRLPKILEYLR